MGLIAFKRADRRVAHQWENVYAYWVTRGWLTECVQGSILWRFALSKGLISIFLLSTALASVQTADGRLVTSWDRGLRPVITAIVNFLEQPAIMFGHGKDQDMAAPAESRRRPHAKFDEAGQVLDSDGTSEKSALASWGASAPSSQYAPVDASLVASHGKGSAPPVSPVNHPQPETSVCGVKMSRSTMLIGLGTLLVLACGYAIFFRGSGENPALAMSYEEDGDGEDFVTVTGTHVSSHR